MSSSLMCPEVCPWPLQWLCKHLGSAPSIFFLHHPEQETSILKVACGHKMAVAALAIASSSPGGKKDNTGNSKRTLSSLPCSPIQ